MSVGQSDPPAAEITAAEMLAALDARRQIAPLTETYSGFDLDVAYVVAAAARQLRVARGERPIGRKIGFTNRTIWEEYGVYAPIWGDMYDSTVGTLDNDGSGTIDLAPFVEPCIEPEIAFGLARAPEADMDETALLDCIDWVAPGFEIAQSLFPGWRFAAADTVAAFGMHGAYRVGPKRSMKMGGTVDWLAALSGFDIALDCNGAIVDRGRGANVLGGPLSALRHLVGLLAGNPQSPPLAAGEIVTTGTLTRAFPVTDGECWRTVTSGLPLDGIVLRMRGA